MNEMTQEIYSEVYSILDLLGNNFIKRLPTGLYDMIKKEKSNTYNPQYTSIKRLEEQDIKRESISMIALFHLNYWCESEEEKQELKDIFLESEEKYQAEIKEKYNPDNIFKKKNVETIKEGNVSINESEMIKYKEDNILKNFIKKVLEFFVRKH